MVIVLTVEAVDVEGDAGTLGKALEAVGNHLAAQLAEELTLESEVDDTVGAVGEVDDGAGEGLVERGVGEAVAGEAGGSAEGLAEGVTESDTDIFSGVVVVNCRVGVSDACSSQDRGKTDCEDHPGTL